MGPTAGSSGLALIIGISEGTLGGLVGVQAFFAAADHVAVWGARVKSMKLFGYPHFPSYDRDRGDGARPAHHRYSREVLP